MEDIAPDFPALVIHHDGSVGSLATLSDWTGDVDQWFWSEPGDYIIDAQGRRFDQRCERARDRRPDSIPEWVFTSLVDEELIASLVAKALKMKREILMESLTITGDDSRVLAMIEKVVEFDAQ